jgi:2'-5' RNA ligase
MTAGGREGGTAPLVLALALDQAATERLDRDRRAHFPPERNHLTAHLTLFHALPGDALDDVREQVAAVARRPPFDVRISGVRLLGRGVAYAVESPDLLAVHRELLVGLGGLLGERLTAQDRQPISPHVTIQNKVAPDRAQELYEQLAEGFEPWSAPAAGLALWRYLGGPWEPVETVPFGV